MMKKKYAIPESPLFRTPALFLLILLSLLTTPAHADKTDIIYLHNGDRITGEIKELLLGEVRVETDTIGDIRVNWTKIKSIESNKSIRFEMVDGTRYFGPISESVEASLVVEAVAGQQILDLNRIVHLQPINRDQGLWERLDKHLRLGFSYTRASDILRWNIATGLKYKALKYQTNFSLESFVTNTRGGADSRRANLTGSYYRHRGNRNFWFGSGSVQTNDELGIDKRYLLSGGLGRFLSQSQRSELVGAVGIAANHEKSTGNMSNPGTSETNLEGVLQFDWTFFKLNTPKSRINSQLQYYPGITDSGRNRVNFNVNVRQEFVKDLFWNVEFFSSFDSKPPQGAQSREDYGVVTSLEYEW